MISQERAIVIQRPVEDVFVFVATVENDPKWRVEVVSIERTSTGPVGRGSTFRWVDRSMGRMSATGEFSDFEPNRKLVIQAVTKPFRVTKTFSFEPIAADTQLTFRLDVQPQGLFKIVGPLMAGMMGKSVQTQLSNLKRVLEGERSSPSGGPGIDT
jgi:uncharacterized protein YndB with AHSA1/START domain